MDVKLRGIGIDAEIADLLDARARGRGMSVSELLADIACNEEALPAEFSDMRAKGEGPWSPECLEEDARRLADLERTRMGVPWNEVKAWIESWGTSNELDRPTPRRP